MIRKILITLLFLSMLLFSQAGSASEIGQDTTTPPGAKGESGVLLESIKGNFDMGVVGAFFQPYIGIFNSPYCTTSQGLKDTLIPSVFVVLFIIIAISFVYMLGQVLQSQNLVMMAKDELDASIKTIALVAILIAMVFGANEWLGLKANPNDPIYSSSPTIIDAAMAYSKFMAYQITSELSGLLVFNTFIQTLYSATVYIGVTLKATFSFNVGPILKPIVDVLGIVIQYLTTALGEWILHYVILCFIKRWTYEIFIPLGILLRAIPQTRNAGNAIFAIFFSLSLIYPIMVISNWEMYKITSFTLLPSSDIVQNFFEESGVLGLGIFGLLLVMTLGSVIMPVIMGLMITVVFDLVKNAIYYIVIVSLLMPFINIFITLTAARETSRGFGSEMNFASFVKLI